MNNISPHITYAEATRTSAQADNTPNTEQLEAMKLLAANVFEPIRALVGRPILITSMFRSAKVNQLIGGASTSQHCKGEAMDIKLPGQNKSLFEIILNQLPFDQLIWEFGTDKEPAWVHVSYKATGNRKQVLKAIRVNGKPKYIAYES
jgi:hypothetical protein